MLKWLTSFVLVAGLTAGALAGVHSHGDEHNCPMKGMGDGCCAKAREHAGPPEVSAARLCCALNCTEPGTTGPTGTFELSPAVAAALHTGAVPPAEATPRHPLTRFHTPPESPPDSHPAYIRHLALLI